jgi:hypothetical protein
MLPGVDNEEQAERQRAERDEDEDPAEVADDPAENVPHDVAEALRAEDAPEDEGERDSGGAPEDDRVDSP